MKELIFQIKHEILQSSREYMSIIKITNGILCQNCFCYNRLKFCAINGTSVYSCIFGNLVMHFSINNMLAEFKKMQQTSGRKLEQGEQWWVWMHTIILKLLLLQRLLKSTRNIKTMPTIQFMWYKEGYVKIKIWYAIWSFHIVAFIKHGSLLKTKHKQW